MLQLEAVAAGVYSISAGTARLRVSAGTYYIPDLCVLPREFVRRKLHEMRKGLGVYDEPMPLVAEVWSPSTGDYDIEEKLSEYQRRGDVEIWRIHPYELPLIARRRQPDGVYEQAGYHGGDMQPVALAGVSIEIDRLFD